MIKVVFLFVLCVIGSGFNSTVEAKNDKTNYSIIEGELSDSLIGVNMRMTIRVTDCSVFDYRDQKEYVLETTNASFFLKLEVDHPVFIDIEAANKWYRIRYTSNVVFGGQTNVLYDNLYGFLLEPGDSIRLNLKNCKNLKEIQFTGKGSEKLYCSQDILKYTDLFSCPCFNPTFHQADSLQRMLTNVFAIYEHKLSPVALVILKAYYFYLFVPYIYKVNNNEDSYRRHPSGKQINGGLSDDYVFINDSALIYSPPFIDRAVKWVAWSNSFIKDSIGRITEKESGPFQLKFYNALVSEIAESSLKNRILSFYILVKLKNYGLNDDLKAAISQYLLTDSLHNPFYNQVYAAYSSFMLTRYKGVPAYNFSLPDTAGNIYTLTNFKNKVVLVDFMFLGCGGCRAMVPYLGKVKDQFKKKDVVFLAISLDKNMIDWKKAIGVYSHAQSIQLYTQGKSINHPIAKYYDVTGAPYLILIDRQGKVVTTRAPDPRKDNGKALVELINYSLAN